MAQKKIRVATLGCKLNQAESEFLARRLESSGYRIVSPEKEADVCILNSCTVTHIADRKSRQALHAMHQKNPTALLIVTGCYAERAPSELSKIQGVKYVLGNEGKERLVKLVGKCLSATGVKDDAQSKPEARRRTRTFVKIQDGCDKFCAYCIVPYVRGREKSILCDQILAEVRELVASGYKEVVLTGTEIGSYRSGGVGLKELIKLILSETDVLRLRLSSLQPQEISPEFAELWQDRRLCRHFHIPLQSGSEAVLSLMKRRYRARDYETAVSLIRAFLPESAITTDVIVGFPGERDGEFEESYNFCRRLHFARIHVFPYSPRPKTEAASMPEQVEAGVKKERSQKMLALAKECAINFRREFLGKTMTVLLEQPAGDSIWSGLTDNYIRVYTRNDEDLTSELTEIKLVRLYKDGVWGETNDKHHSPQR